MHMCTSGSSLGRCLSEVHSNVSSQGYIVLKPLLATITSESEMYSGVPLPLATSSEDRGAKNTVMHSEAVK